MLDGGLTLTFLGTRGEIEARTPEHLRHSALLVRRDGTRLMVDCGLDWLGRLPLVRPDAILLTHAHVDHAGGLRHGAECPVYASEETLRSIRRFPLAHPVVVRPRSPFRLLGLEVEAFPVEHSLVAPAVGFRLGTGDVNVFYAPDVLELPERAAALREVDLYVGDGASVARSIVRRRGPVGIGHASIRAQLDWCAAERVPWAIFTHCGSQVVRSEPQVSSRVAVLGRERGVRAELARDGLSVLVPQYSQERPAQPPA